MQSAHFWNANADKYYRTPINDVGAYEHKLALTRQYLTSQDRILEVGCGTGATAIAHAAHVAHVTGTDISERMIEYAWSRVNDAGASNVTFEVAAIETLRADQPYDAVLAMSLLHLVRDRSGALARLRNLIKPSGYFFSSTACLADRMGFVRPVLPVMRLFGAAPWVAIFKEDQLRAEIESAGFEIIERFRPETRAGAVFFVARRAGSA
jgi:2-polyprenyl-3-methyl-5-hydroxy-6-metoxy-1,4-benzoquinol methylase